MDLKLKLFEAYKNEEDLLISKQSSSVESFPDLFKKLIKVYVEKSSKTFQNSEFLSLKSSLYSIIFSYREDKGTLPTVNNLEQLLWYAYTLRQGRKFDEANKLNRYLKYLQDKGLLYDDSVLQNILRLLICLTGNGERSYQDQLAIPAPRIISPNNVENLGLPSEPLCYNETRWDCAPARWHYTHFPSELFRVEESVLFTQNEALPWGPESFNACNKFPGTGHKFNFFKEAEYDASKSCLGALAGPRKIKSPLTPDTVLTIPNLPSVPHEYSFIPFIRHRSQEQSATPPEKYARRENEMVTVDEGYVSSHGSEEGKSPSKWDKKDIWQHFPFQTVKLPSKRYSWENAIGLNTPSREKPFISEAGAQVTQRLWSIEQLHISTLDPSMKLPSHLHMPSEAELCMHILYLLIGLPSSSFIITKENVFKAKEGLCYRGSAPASLEPHLKELAECGEQILGLEDFCRAPSTDESECSRSTLALQSFQRPVRAFLFYYRQKVLLLKGETKFLSLKLRSFPLRRKVHYVYRLVRDGTEREWFSDTLNLISGLKKELLLTQNASNLCLLLSFVNAASKPFLVFLEKWLYEGDICSPEAGFLILTDSDALQRRTRRYWTHGYRLCDEFAERVPDFLKSVLSRVFLCGKSVNLLRICFPQSFLLSNMSEKHPTINLCSSLNQVYLAKLQCEKYALEMTKLSSQHLVTLAMLDEEKRKREEQLVTMASERNLEFLRGFKEMKNIVRLSEAERKRETMEILREDIKQSKNWKKKREELERKEDEKVILEQSKYENQKEAEEQQQRAAIMAQFEKKMSGLESSEVTVKRELASLKRSLNLDSVWENDEASRDLEEGEENGKEITETDNDSVSGMSTTSDLCSETPNDEAIGEMSTPDKVAQAKIQTEDFTPNPIEPNNNDDDVQEDLLTATTYCKETLATKIVHSVADELNHNALLNQIVGLQEERRSETDLGDVFCPVKQKQSQDSAKDVFTTYSLDKNRNSSLMQVVESEEGSTKTGESNSSKMELNLKHDTKITTNTEDCNDIITEGTIKDEVSKANEALTKSMSLASSHNELDPTVDENKNPSSDLIRGEDSLTEPFRMRKSKSESSSLKDSGKKMSQRMSLFDLNESDAPVLIDKVGGEVLKRRGRNTHGHASDSVIQDILRTKTSDDHHGDKELPRAPLFERDQLETLATSSILPVSSYSTDLLEQGSMMDVTSSFLNKCRKDSTATERVPPNPESLPRPSQLSFAPIYFARGIAEHLAIQSRMVNEALLSHFVVERNLLEHFKALKDFLLLHDAAFAHALIPSLLHKCQPGHHLVSQINPAEINAILNEAIAASTSPKSPYASNLTFVVKNIPDQILSHPMDCIELRYIVEWPICIILDDKALAVYAALSKFLSRLRQVVWAIEDVFKYTMTIRLNSFHSSERLLFHRLYIFRHEVQQFVRVLFGYICHQAVEGSWWIFQRNLRRVSTFDELYECHWRFVNDVSEKCFLTSDTEYIQIQIQELFGEVLLFQNLTKNRIWQRATSPTSSSQTPELTAIESLMTRFRKISQNLSKTLQLSLLRLVYSDHVEDLVTQMTFNDRFQSSISAL